MTETIGDMGYTKHSHNVTGKCNSLRYTRERNLCIITIYFEILQQMILTNL